MPNSTPDKNNLLIKLALISSITTAIALLLGIYVFNLVFITLTFSLLISNSIVFWFARKRWFDWGIHLILVSHLMVFLIGSMIGFVGYSLLLMYPAVLYMAMLFLTKESEKRFYVILAMVSSIISIYLMLQPVLNTDSIVNFIVETIIVTGLLLGVYLIGQSHLSKLTSYQHELEQNELIIIEKNKELTKYIENNLNLESFAHLASHELKTPVRNISNFTGLLKRKIEDKLVKEESEILDYIIEQTRYMYRLIENLLNLSSLSNNAQEVVKIQLHELLTEVIKNNFISQKDQIRIKEIPSQVSADSSELSVVIKNIIENGLKYVKKGVTPQIEIYGEESSNYTTICISDNGIGIDPKYSENIFLIFKRLHIQSEYEGNGFGLAYCKKIIENHNGMIKVSKNQNGGSIFSILLPKINA